MSAGDSSVLHLDVEFYGTEHVRKAIAEFRKYLKADLSTTDTNVILKVEVEPRYRADVQRILHEFLNYTLDLSLKRHFGADK